MAGPRDASLRVNITARDLTGPGYASAMARTRAAQQEVFKLDNAMRGVARRMASRVLLIGGAIAAASGHVVALTAAIWPLVGALGAIPAVTVGGVAGIAALVTGFAGLGKAMRQTGGGAGRTADQIVAAQRRMERANRNLRDAQEALNDAFESARDRLRDIQTSYAGAKLDVESAALAVREAELALRKARSGDDRLEVKRADLALRQARLSHIEAINRLNDVEQEYNERLEKGVEGSDEVRDATERQADALEELADAQKALNEAMKGGGGSGGEDAYAKLSRSAKDLVDTLRRLGPEWRKVQQATQQALFAGVAVHVQRLSERYLPVMQRQLPEIARGWNKMLTGIAGVASRANRVRDIDESLGLMAVMWQRIGTSFGKFFEGFIDWVRVGSDFLPRLGNWVDEHAERFRNWSRDVRETGRAFRWIENALTTGHLLNELIKSWSRSLFEVFRLGQDKTLLVRLIEGSKAFEAWLETAEGQERITRMWERMRDVGSTAWQAIKEALDVLSQIDVTPLTVVLQVLANVLSVVADNMGVVNAFLGPLITVMVAMKVATVVATSAQALYNAAIGRFVTLAAASAAAAKAKAQADKDSAAAAAAAAGGASKLGIASAALGSYLASVSIAGSAAAAMFGKDLNPKTDALAKSFEQLGETGEASGEAARLFGGDLKGLGDAMKVANIPGWLRGWTRSVDQFTGVGAKFSFTTTNMEERVKAADDALATLVRSGKTQEATAAFQELLEATGNTEAPVEKLKELFPEYFAALEAGEGVQRNTTDAIKESVDAWREAANSLEAYMDKLQEQTDPIFRYMRSQERVAEAQAEVNRLIAEGKEGTPEYESALMDLTEATLDMRSAMADAAAVDQNILVPAMQDLVEQGILTQQQADQITAAYKRVQDQARSMQGMRTQIYLDVYANTAALQKAMSGYYAQYGAFLAAGFRQHGGPVKKGEPYVVGEAGPELFIPEQSGRIEPSHRIGTAVGAQEVRIVVDIRGGDADMKRMVRKWFRVEGPRSFGLQPA